MTADEFRPWLHEQVLERAISYLLIHHTWSPSYKDFNGANHGALQQGMKRYHTVDRGWDDIGQHFSIFPDGTIMTGRPLELIPACTRGANVGSICFENVGNFDVDGDVMTPQQAKAIVECSAWVCERFAIPVDRDHVLYHHWFDLNTARRTDGTGTTKSCPGTGFFGGNTVEAAEAGFFPLVQHVLES